MRETTRDVCFLHNETFWAAAQKKYVYIYDKRGIEIHCLRDHEEPAALQFLPHQFLLCSVGEHGECATHQHCVPCGNGWGGVGWGGVQCMQPLCALGWGPRGGGI